MFYKPFWYWGVSCGVLGWNLRRFKLHLENSFSLTEIMCFTSLFGIGVGPAAFWGEACGVLSFTLKIPSVGFQTPCGCENQIPQWIANVCMRGSFEKMQKSTRMKGMEWQNDQFVRSCVSLASWINKESQQINMACLQTFVNRWNESCDDLGWNLFVAIYDSPCKSPQSLLRLFEFHHGDLHNLLALFILQAFSENV